MCSMHVFLHAPCKKHPKTPQKKNFALTREKKHPNIFFAPTREKIIISLSHRRWDKNVGISALDTLLRRDKNPSGGDVIDCAVRTGGGFPPRLPRPCGRDTDVARSPWSCTSALVGVVRRRTCRRAGVKSECWGCGETKENTGGGRRFRYFFMGG